MVGVASINLDGPAMQADSIEKRECLQGLFLTDPIADRQRLVDTKGRRVEGTCSWVLKEETYRSFVQNPASDVLWISGGPGKGKTFISIFLTEELEKHTRQSRDSRVVAYYFCNGGNEKCNSASAVLRGLISQFLQQRPALYDILLPKCRELRERLFSPLAFDELWKIFESMARNTEGVTYCLIDGLDEIDVSSLESLVQRIKILFDKTGPARKSSLKLLLVSRAAPACLPIALGSFKRVDIDKSPRARESMKLFIAARTTQVFTEREYSSKEKTNIPTLLNDGADGAFLWVDLVCHEFLSKDSKQASRLDKLPPDLDFIYRNALVDILSTHTESESYTISKLLGLITVAARPLSIAELCVAMIPVPLNQNEYVDDVVSGNPKEIEDLLDSCSAFIRIQGEDDTVVFFHYSAREYLLSAELARDAEVNFFSVDESAHVQITHNCLRTIKREFIVSPIRLVEPNNEDMEWRRELFEDRSGERRSEELVLGPIEVRPRDAWRIKLWERATDKSRLHESPFLEYATRHWPDHLRAAEASLDSFVFLANYFDQRDRRNHMDSSIGLILKSRLPIVQLNLWWESYWHAKKEEEDNSSGDFTLLHLAAYFNLRDLAEEIETHPIKVARSMSKRVQDWIPNSKKVLPLGPKVHIDTTDGAGRTALFVAVWQGNVRMIQLLLSRGANPNIPRASDGATPLHEATYQGKELVVELLLRTGADPNMATTGASVIYLAAWNGFQNIVKLLLKYGADPNHQCPGSIRGGALHGAVMQRQIPIIEYLLQKKVDPNFGRACDEATPLYLAIKQKDNFLVQLLIRSGANPNTPLKREGNNALHHVFEANKALANQKLPYIAAAEGSSLSIRMEAPLPRDGFLRAPKENWFLFKVLLEEGASPHVPDKWGQLLLHKASASLQMEDVVKLLLQHGADPNRRDHNGDTALHLVALSNSVGKCRLLLESGGDPTIWDGHKRTAVDRAVNLDEEELVKVYREVACTRNVRKSGGWLPLPKFPDLKL